jgi:hypothetical protein
MKNFRDRYHDMARTLGFDGPIAWAEGLIRAGCHVLTADVARRPVGPAACSLRSTLRTNGQTIK